MNRLIFLGMICLAPICLVGQITSITNAKKETDSLEIVVQSRRADSTYVDAGIRLGGRYMDFSQPGKAQEVLEKVLPIADSLSYDKGSYFVRSYLAEIFFQAALYDNALYMLRRATAFADKLQNNELIADSWNIMGLIYQEMHIPDSALRYFKNSLALMPVHKKDILESSYRYQVKSNLGQVFLQIGNTDSAWFYLQASLQEADSLQAFRGMAIAEYYSGTIVDKKEGSAKAMEYYRKAIAYADKIEDKDVIAFIYPSVANALFALKKKSVNDSVSVYDKFLNTNEDRISFSTQKEYYSQMTKIFARNRNEKAFWYQQKLNDIEKKIDNEALQKRLPVLINLVSNERRLATLEQERVIHAQQLKLNRNLLFFMITLLVLFGIVLIVFLINRRQKQLLVVQKIKNDISAALHDEMAASLTGINLFGKLAEEELKNQPGNAAMYTKKMRIHAESLAGHIADIVWIINGGNNKGLALIAKLEAFCKQQEYGISVKSNKAFLEKKISTPMCIDLFLLCKRLVYCVCQERDHKNMIFDLLLEESNITSHLSATLNLISITEDEIVKNKLRVLQAVYNITTSGNRYIFNINIPC